MRRKIILCMCLMLAGTLTGCMLQSKYEEKESVQIDTSSLQEYVGDNYKVYYPKKLKVKDNYFHLPGVKIVVNISVQENVKESLDKSLDAAKETLIEKGATNIEIFKTKISGLESGILKYTLVQDKHKWTMIQGVIIKEHIGYVISAANYDSDTKDAEKIIYSFTLTK